jgi:hypothetical protein
MYLFVLKRFFFFFQYHSSLKYNYRTYICVFNKYELEGLLFYNRCTHFPNVLRLIFSTSVMDKDSNNIKGQKGRETKQRRKKNEGRCVKWLYIGRQEKILLLGLFIHIE